MLTCRTRTGGSSFFSIAIFTSLLFSSLLSAKKGKGSGGPPRRRTTRKKNTELQHLSGANTHLSTPGWNGWVEITVSCSTFDLAGWDLWSRVMPDDVALQEAY